MTVRLRDAGFVTEEFIALGATTNRTPEQEEHLTDLKREMTQRLLRAGTSEVYELL
ncbi:hypothetical protein ACLQ3K_09920 [Tsukamurella sp. DT100]|uniref:hypothetical protein n=1 Tax=Tsukamurella sp. DT100 TaxID=3393415 RepID=UPI003CFAA609